MSHDHRLRRFGLGLAALVAMLALRGAPAARAGGSAPILAITTARAVTTGAGVRALTITGTFNFDDLVQFDWPAGLIVTQGTHFVRYDETGTVREGTWTNGAITDLNVGTLLASGTAAAPPAAIGQLRTNRFTVALPSGFAAGAATAILYAQLGPDEAFVSNVQTVVLP